MPAGQSGPGRRLGGQPSGEPTERRDRSLELVEGEAPELGGDRRQVRLGGVGPVLPRGLEPGGAGVPDVGAAELPDDPVGRLDPVVHPVVELGILLEQLQALGERPLGRELAAVPSDPRLAPFVRDAVEPVGVRLGGVVLPQLHVGVRAIGVLGQLAERGAVGEHREHGAGGEVGADPDDLLGRDPGGPDRTGHRLGEGVDVVARHLEGPVGRQRHPGLGQGGVHDTVPVLGHGGGQLGSVGHPHHHGAGRERPQVHPDDDDVVAPRRHAPIVADRW